MRPALYWLTERISRNTVQTAIRNLFFFQKTRDGDERSKFEMDRIQHAKRIMKPFFLRRLKADVLKALPEKTIELLKVPMTTEQHMTYFRLVQEYKKRAKDVSFLKKLHHYFYL